MNDREFIEAVRVAARAPSGKEAARWSQVVATALADVAPDSQTRRQFITQLPDSLKSHVQSQTPRGLVMDAEAFVQHVGALLDLHARDAERVLLAVWSVVRRAVSAGELADFEGRVPARLAALLRTAA